MTDRFGTQLLTTNVQAATDFAEATARVLGHRPDVDVALARAVAADPACAGAHALRGLCQTTLARTETMAAAHVHLADAESALVMAGGSAADYALVRALRRASQGGLRAAAETCEAHVEMQPQAVLFAKLAQAFRFMSGDTHALGLAVDRALEASSPGAPAHGYLLGCRSFAFEELGEFALAEQIGRQALDLEPMDAWAIHAVSHVYEMTGRVEAGLGWVEAQRPVWQGCNNFALHMSWHAALFHMERGDGERALVLYDTEIWPRVSEDYRDVSNAVALLGRLDSLGVRLGARWDVLADLAERRRADCTLTFASLHHLLALLAAGRLGAAADLVENLERSMFPANDQERVLRLVGRNLARVLLDDARGLHRALDPAMLRDLPAIGGSAAQRDLFVRRLAELAAERGDQPALAALLSVRRRLKSDDRFVASLAAPRVSPGPWARRIA